MNRKFMWTKRENTFQYFHSQWTNRERACLIFIYSASGVCVSFCCVVVSGVCGACGVWVCVFTVCVVVVVCVGRGVCSGVCVCVCVLL